MRGEEGDSIEGEIAELVIGTGEDDAPTMETGDGDERGELDRFPKYVGVGLLTFLMRPCRKFCSSKVNKKDVNNIVRTSFHVAVGFWTQRLS